MLLQLIILLLFAKLQEKQQQQQYLMMTTLHTTLRLNNRAVELSHSNYIHEAVKTYHQSLSSIRDLTRTDDESDAIPHTPSRWQERLHRSVHSSRNIFERSDELFLYQNTLVLHEAASSSQNVRIYGAAILFNTAILYHQISCQTGHSASMDKAQELYQSSLRLLQGIPPNSNDTVILLIIANNNNLALIELDKGCVMEAGERLRYLSHLFHTIRPTIRRIFAIDECKSLFSNTLLHDGLIAPPAA